MKIIRALIRIVASFAIGFILTGAAIAIVDAQEQPTDDQLLIQALQGRLAEATLQLRQSQKALKESLEKCKPESKPETK